MRLRRLPPEPLLAQEQVEYIWTLADLKTYALEILGILRDDGEAEEEL